jgi:endonuclease-8
MPEGHTVHRVAALFTQDFVGHCVHTSSPQGRFADGAASLDGREVERAFAVGKQLFVEFDHGLTLRVHLGIYGAWSVINRGGRHSLGAPRVKREEGLSESDADQFPPDPVGQVRLRVATDEVVADLRGPTVCELIDRDEAAAFIETLGPDPLVDGAKKGAKRFIEKMRTTSTPIALALMNQKLVSGIGNVYRAELLFRHRLDPFVPAKSLSDEVLEALWKDWSVLLKDGVKTGVMRTRNDLTPAENTKALRNSRIRYFVYKRQGQPCRACGEPIVLTELGGRKLYYCPVCQIEPR